MQKGKEIPTKRVMRRKETKGRGEKMEIEEKREQPVCVLVGGN